MPNSPMWRLGQPQMPSDEVHEMPEGGEDSESSAPDSNSEALTLDSVSTPASDSICLNPCKHHPIYAKYPEGLDLPHISNLSGFVQQVSRGVQNSFPRRPREYEKAHALFIYWPEDDIGTQPQVERLEHYMKKLHFTASEDTFTTSIYRIESDPTDENASEMLLQEQLVILRNRFARQESNLLIIYYGGHGKMNEAGQCIWYARKPFDSSPSLNWTTLVNDLVLCNGNILFILDCCCATGMVSPVRFRGIKELLAACGKSDSTSAEDYNAFTNAVIQELIELEGSSCNISTLQTRLMGNHPDLHATPIRVPLSDRASTESIVLRYAEDADNRRALAPRNLTQESLSSDARVLIAIRLENPAVTPRVDDWTSWIRTYAPAGIAQVEVDLAYVHPVGLFQSRSTLLLATIPISVWNLVPSHPGYTFIDIIASENLLTFHPPVPVPLSSSSIADAGKVNPESSKDVFVRQPVSTSSPDPPATAAYASRETLEKRRLTTPALVSTSPPAPISREAVLLRTDALSQPKSHSSMSEQAVVWDSRKVRIAVIKPGDTASELVIFLRDVSVENLSQIDYDAISLAWEYGEPSVPVRARKDNSATFHEVNVYPNLVAMLKVLRQVSTDRNVWVDQICVDFSDSDDHAFQFSMMGQMFYHAKNVHVWLCLEPKPNAVAVLGDILANFDIHNVPGLHNLWQELGDILDSRWFTRRWIIREVAFASHVVIHIGPTEIDWADFIVLLDLIFGYIETLQPPSTQSIFMERNRLKVRRARQIANVSMNALQKRTVHGVRCLIPMFSLEYLVSSLNTFEVSNSKDVIYAFLDIAKETAPMWVKQPWFDSRESPSVPGEIHMDYSATLEQVCTDFVQWVVGRTASLDIICRPWLPLPSHVLRTLPSWIRGKEYSSLGELGSVNGDSFAGLPGSTVYSASQNLPPALVIHEKVLSAQGILLDEIVWATTPVQNNIIQRSCLERAGWKTGRQAARSSAPDKLWRTLVADRGRDGKQPPAYYRASCEILLKSLGVHDDLDIDKAMEKIPVQAEEYWRRVRDVVCNRVFLETENGPNGSSERYFGLGPPMTRVGDVLCVLSGCSVPVVLRKLPPVVSMFPSDKYELIGECYIYQAMDGETLENAQIDEETLHMDEETLQTEQGTVSARTPPRMIFFNIM